MMGVRIFPVPRQFGRASVLCAEPAVNSAASRVSSSLSAILSAVADAPGRLIVGHRRHVAKTQVASRGKFALINSAHAVRASSCGSMHITRTTNRIGLKSCSVHSGDT